MMTAEQNNYMAEVAMCIVKLSTDRQRLVIYMTDAKVLRDRCLEVMDQGRSIASCAHILIKEYC